MEPLSQPKTKRTRYDSENEQPTVSLLDQVVFDLEDGLDPHRSNETHQTPSLRTLVRTDSVPEGSNGVDLREDEGSDEYEDSEEEFTQAPSKKIKLEKVVKKEKKQKEVVEPEVKRVLMSRDSRNEVDDEEEDDDSVSFLDAFRSRKIPFIGQYEGSHWIKSRGFEAHKFSLVG